MNEPDGAAVRQAAGRVCPIVVGRVGELRELGEVLAAARAGRGRLACLTGEVGIGKSRLVRELIVRAGAESMQVAVGRAVPAGASIPYRPWTEAVLALLRERPLPDDPGLRAWLPVLGTVVPTLAAAAGSGEASATACGEALVRLLGCVAGTAGLLLVVEDLHWADPDSLAVLEYLADNLTGVGVLCVATVRSEPPSPALRLVRRLQARRTGTHLLLPRLAGPQVAQMVRACLPVAGPAAVAAAVAVVARVADGVPFLVEEVLAAPGVPASFADTVEERLAGLGPEPCRVLQAAAVLGRRFDWRLLAAITGVSAQSVGAALEQGVRALLLATDGDGFRFRHALTHEAILAALLPPQRSALAAAALAAVTVDTPQPLGVTRELAADLAVQAGDLPRAGALLASSGAEALQRGALGTAIDTLTQAVAYLPDTPARDAARTRLVEALALAGRVDEAMTVGEHLINGLAARGAGGADRAQVHVQMAAAAVAATRWLMAHRHLDSAAALMRADPGAEISAQAAVLDAEIALAADDLDRAGQLVEQVLAEPAAPAAVHAHAWQLLGRIRRLNDLPAAQSAFEQALRFAENAGLPVWQLRALLELGTIELLDHAGTARLLQARDRAEALGLVSRVAVVDLQLSAAAASVFALDEALVRARQAIATAKALGLPQIRATAWCVLAEVYAIRDRPDQLERVITEATAIVPDEREVRGFCRGARGMHALLYGDRTDAVAAFWQEAEMFRGGHANPAYHRGILPLLLAAEADPRARLAIDANRDAGLQAFFAHAGLLAWAEAILAGRAGEHDRAGELAHTAEQQLRPYPGWVELARLLAAPCARADRWGSPLDWLRAARDGFTTLGLPGPAGLCEGLLGGPPPGRWAHFGLTARESEVLALVVQGMANKQIAEQLTLSVRTVEKHLEALLRKTASSSRTRLTALALGEPGPDPGGRPPG